MPKLIELPNGKVELREDGILHVHIAINRKMVLEEAMEFFKARVELSAGKAYPILYTTEKKMVPSKKIRKHMASKARTNVVLADAFVIHSLFQRYIANTYFLINKPYHPTEVFTSEEKAIKWLKSFVK